MSSRKSLWIRSLGVVVTLAVVMLCSLNARAEAVLGGLGSMAIGMVEAACLDVVVAPDASFPTLATQLAAAAAPALPRATAEVVVPAVAALTASAVFSGEGLPACLLTPPAATDLNTLDRGVFAESIDSFQFPTKNRAKAARAATPRLTSPQVQFPPRPTQPADSAGNRPESSAMIVAGLGAMGLVFRRRRRSAQPATAAGQAA